MGGVIGRLAGLARHWWTYGVLCRGDKVRYLRRLGVRIGEECWIYTAVGNFGSEPYLVEIGDRVTLTDGVIPLTHDASSRLFRHDRPGMNPEFGNRFATVRILDNSFVGINAIILPGVTIGPDSIVGTGSVVTKDVPPGTVYAGNPARFICTLEEYVERYQRKMVPVEARDRPALRKELTRRLWGEER